MSTNFTTSAGGETILPGAGFQALRYAGFAAIFAIWLRCQEPSLGNRFKPCILTHDRHFVQCTSAKCSAIPGAN
ncbi:hypothetical protein, partial [Cupriavidus sp. HPC(L)]|uniref:hypothetical protein n=1 Tax=Cupriavidus sp. HPC(L) TaxID=1217418 RepID=UPI001C12867D